MTEDMFEAAQRYIPAPPDITGATRYKKLRLADAQRNISDFLEVMRNHAIPPVDFSPCKHLHDMRPDQVHRVWLGWQAYHVGHWDISAEWYSHYLGIITVDGALLEACPSCRDESSLGSSVAVCGFEVVYSENEIHYSPSYIAGNREALTQGAAMCLQSGSGRWVRQPDHLLEVS